VTRLRTWLALIVLLTACQNESQPALSPAPTPSPHIAPTVRDIAIQRCASTVNVCVGSGPLDVYLAVLESADPKLAGSCALSGSTFSSHGARAGAISVLAANPPHAKAELGHGHVPKRSQAWSSSSDNEGGGRTSVAGWQCSDRPPGTARQLPVWSVAPHRTRAELVYL